MKTGWYTAFAYNDESLDECYEGGIRIHRSYRVEVNSYPNVMPMWDSDCRSVGADATITVPANSRHAQYISTTLIDSALLQTGYPVNMTTEGSDSLLLTMYGRDALDVNEKFMQDGD